SDLSRWSMVNSLRSRGSSPPRLLSRPAIQRWLQSDPSSQRSCDSDEHSLRLPRHLCGSREDAKAKQRGQRNQGLTFILHSETTYSNPMKLDSFARSDS